MTPTPYFQRDGVTIYHGDAIDVLPTLSGIGAVVTDPPYSSGGQFRGDRTRATTEKYVNSDTISYRPDFGGDNRDQRSFLAWCMMWMNAARIASVPGAVLCSFTDWRQLPTLSDALQCGGWTWRNICTWHKPGVRMQKSAFSLSAEYILFGTNGPRDWQWSTANSPQNVFACQVDREREHIAQKPVDVMQWILQVVDIGATVLDPFMGSGTTLVAARDRGCPAIGIEADERYCEMAARRLAQGVLEFG